MTRTFTLSASMLALFIASPALAHHPYGQFSGFVSVGIPVVNEMNGLQSEPEYRVIGGLAASF